MGFISLTNSKRPQGRQRLLIGGRPLQFPLSRAARRGALIAFLMTGVAGGAFAQTSGAATPNCYASFSSWLDSSAADCPLSAYGITFYGTIDVGGGYESHGAPFNGDAKTGVSELISKANNGSRWQEAPNGLTQSNFGIRMRERIFTSDWFLVGDINAGFDPLSL